MADDADGWSQGWSSASDLDEHSSPPARRPLGGFPGDRSGYEQEDEDEDGGELLASTLRTPERPLATADKVTIKRESSSDDVRLHPMAPYVPPSPSHTLGSSAGSAFSRPFPVPVSSSVSRRSLAKRRTPQPALHHHHHQQQQQQQQQQRRKPRRSRPSDASSALEVSMELVSSAVDLTAKAVSIPIRILGVALNPLLTVLLALSMVTLTAYLAWLSLSAPVSFLLSRLAPPSLPSSTALITSTLSTLSTPLCLLLPLPFCPPSTSGRSSSSSSSSNQLLAPVASLARTVSESARQATSIFESVVDLGDPGRLGLHQAEVWELAVAVRATSGLVGKEGLADEIAELGFLTRDVKDGMIAINSMGLNAFSFIVHEFSRIQDLLSHVHSGSRRYPARLLSHNLDLLFSRLSSDLSSLLDLVDRAIPLASRASDLGGRVMELLAWEHARLNREKEARSVWTRAVDRLGVGPEGTFRSRQLARDLELTGLSVGNLRRTRMKLEDARSALVAYRENASQFKAAVVGWHVAEHGLTAEDELFALRHIMADFKRTVSHARGQGRLGLSSRPHLPSVGPGRGQGQGRGRGEVGERGVMAGEGGEGKAERDRIGAAWEGRSE